MTSSRPRRPASARHGAWHRLTAGALGATVILALGLTALSLGRQNLAAAEGDRLIGRSNLVKDVASAMAPELDPAQQVAVTSLPRFTASPGAVNEVLLRQNLGDPALSGVAFAALLDRDGRVVQALPAGTQLDVAELGDAWPRVLAGEPAVADGVRRGDAVVSTTVWPAGPAPAWGVLAMGVVLARTSTQEYFTTLGSQNGGPGGLFVADRRGTALAAWDPALVGRPVVDPRPVRPTDGPSVTVAGAGADEVTTVTLPFVDGHVIGFQQRTDLLMADLRAAQGQRDLTLVGVLAAALVGLVAFQLSREVAARRDEARIDGLLRNSRDIVLVTDPAGRVTFASAAVETLLGRPAGDWLDQPVTAAGPPADAGRLAALVADPGSGPALNVRLRTAAGDDRWFDVEARDLRGHPEVAGILLTCHEIGERRRLQDELEHEVAHDRLTGLANRAAFGERLERLVTDGDPRRPLTLLFVDLDGFKPVNDALGHDAGDKVLATVARRLADALGPDASVARLGGDEFVAVLDGTGAATAPAAAQAVLDAVREPIPVAAQLVHVDASIGVVTAGPGDRLGNVEQLVRVADDAMYRAKQQGRGRFEVAAPRAAVAAADALEGSRLAGPAADDPAPPDPGGDTGTAGVPASASASASGERGTTRPRHRTDLAPLLVAAAVVLGIAGVGFAQTVIGRRTAEAGITQSYATGGARAAVYFSRKYDTRRYQYIAETNPWTLTGSPLDHDIIHAWATNPAAGRGTHALLLAPDGRVLASEPPGLPASPTADPHWADALAGRGVYLPWIEDADVPRSYMLLPVHRDGRVAAVVALGVSVREGAGAETLRRATEASIPDGGWHLLDEDGVVYTSWNPTLIGQRVADPGEIAALPPGEARVLEHGDRIIVVSPITSTAVPTYVAFDVPAAALFHDLRVGQTARDLSLLALVIGAVAGLAAVNHRRVGAVRRSERRLDALVQQAHDVVVVLDAAKRPIFVSSAVSRLLGYAPDEVTLDLFPPEDRERLDVLMEEVGRRGSASATDIRVRDRREAYVWFDVDAVDLRSHPEIAGFVLTFHEVSERKALQDQLAERATRDPLTGLPNRAALGRRLDRLVERTDRRPFAVLFVDLDHFKPVNDTYGHDVGDEVLRIIARRFERSVRTGDGETGDLVSRLGGDEFAIVLADATPGTAEATARRLLQATRQPVTVGAVTVQIAATIGISLSDPGLAHPDTVLREADRAMYRAKETGRDTFAVAPRAGPGPHRTASPETGEAYDPNTVHSLEPGASPPTGCP